MANGKEKAVVFSLELRVNADPTMEKVTGERGILRVKISD
jgi:hypothetical protein